MSHPTTSPAVSAFAVVHPRGATPALTHDQARADHIASFMGGTVHPLFTAPALLAHVMNTEFPDPEGPCACGAIQYLARVNYVANKLALVAIRTGWPVSDDNGKTWWIDTAPLLDQSICDPEGIADHQHLIAIALHSRTVVRHPTQPTWVQIVSTTAGKPLAPTTQVPA